MKTNRDGARRWRTIAILATGVAIGTMLTATPVYSHVGGTVGHLWKKHIRPKADARYYTKTQADALYAPMGSATSGDAQTLDGLDSTEFLRVNGKAADADKLDGRDSAGYLRSSTYRRAATGVGTNDNGQACGGDQRCVLQVSCDATDTLIVGGVSSVDNGTHLMESFVSAFVNIGVPGVGTGITVPTQWTAEWVNNNTADEVTVSVFCARGRATSASG